MTKVNVSSEIFKPVDTFAGIVRLLTSCYVVILSALTLLCALTDLSIGAIIGSVHMLSGSLCLFGLELDIIQLSGLADDISFARTIALQFLSAALIGMNKGDPTLFIMGCVAFGFAVGLTQFSGIYSLGRNARVKLQGEPEEGSGKAVSSQGYTNVEPTGEAE